MAKIQEDNFRIEVWNREETALVETICLSPDSLVSQAAWQSASRSGRECCSYTTH
ncbi:MULTISPECIES: hypothetical protein [unclassified Mesorhizobium]|uniref:hypothetical protein n=1 Tax=unclassified Mesorhizobium TaxID=325217 RepID=UPI0013E2AE8D|nr:MULTISPECIES: hypothetical protein [unclassified Mesorhizobium]